MIKVQIYFTCVHNNYAKLHKSADSYIKNRAQIFTNRFTGFPVLHPFFFSLH